MKPLDVVPIPPPTVRVRRDAAFAAEGERRSRYHLPDRLSSSSPVGYRTRLSMSRADAEALMPLLALDRPTGFAAARPLIERELFDECALGVLSSRQSTNFRGQRQITVGPEDAAKVAAALRACGHGDAEVLDGAGYAHIVLTRPYRTAFTALLTFVGHRAVANLLTVPLRAWRKRYLFQDDIPTIGYLQALHVGILADSMERAAVIASNGARRAQVHLAPFVSPARRQANAEPIRALEALCGLGRRDRAQGWRIAMVVQVGEALPTERIDVPAPLLRALGANLLAFRSERIQPGVNAEEKAPPPYRERQVMDVPEDLPFQAGRAAYNAFAHWTGIDREKSKDLLLLDRIDVLTPGGKERLRSVRKMLDNVTDKVVENIPWWADLPTGRALTRNAARGKKAFALAGQRVYLIGLSRREVATAGLDWDLAITAVGAAAGRGALYAELMGTVDLPVDCDLLAGICLMAGPVNQNDIGKAFFGDADLLGPTYADRDPTSLLVWTLKAKTVADPIGNEQQLMDARQKGALVDLRAGPDDVIAIRKADRLAPMRSRDGKVNDERAFADLNNFVTDATGREVVGNRGETWRWRDEPVW